MRKTFSVFRLAPYALCALSLFGLQAYGQDRDNDKDRTNDHPNGIVQDWSRRHAVYPRFGPIHSLIAVQHDPRALQSWQASAREDWHRARRWRHPHDRESSFHRDWNIGLGTGQVAPAMYPAKFGFDPNAAVTVANCPTDFVVFPLDVTGSATQPNIVAFNQLYSGTTGSTGICNRAPPPSGDDGVSATTFWSYNIQAAGGQVPTSPTISLDGTKVAFVESAPATTAHFHVLAWKSGDGVDVTTPNAQNVLKPVTITSGFAALAPAAGSGTVTDLALGSTSDTLSSPFVDYNNDLAYIGNDSGVLYRIKNVFCPALSACGSGGTPAPSLDATWGTGGALTIGGTCTGGSGKLTGAVIAGNGNILVGCADGKLYGFTPTGTPLTPLIVGDGSATGGIVDPPLVDEVNGFVYVVSGSSSGGTSVLVQASATDLSLKSTATLDPGGAFNLHAPAFNDAYYSQPAINSSTWLIYSYSGSVSGPSITLWGSGFDSSRIMSPNTPANSRVFGIGPFEMSPLTEFMSGGVDSLFVSDVTNNTGGASIDQYVITGGFLPLGTYTSTATEASGTSGIIVDNASGSAQAASIYFGTLGTTGLNTNSAVKLTQSGLN